MSGGCIDNLLSYSKITLQPEYLAKLTIETINGSAYRCAPWGVGYASVTAGSFVVPIQAATVHLRYEIFVSPRGNQVLDFSAVSRFEWFYERQRRRTALVTTWVCTQM